MAGRDWRDMTRDLFDTDAGPPTLFALEPAQVSPCEPCGTGDLLALLNEKGSNQSE